MNSSGQKVDASKDPGDGTSIDHFSIWGWCLLLVMAASLFVPGHAFAAVKEYYYIQVASLRVEKSAVQLAQRLRNNGYPTVARGDQVFDLGYWYFVYVGPFFSSQEAHLKIKELRSRGLVKSCALHEKRHVITSNVGKPADVLEKRVESVGEIIPPEAAKAPAVERPVTVSPPQEKRPKVKQQARAAAPPEKRRVAEPPPPAKPKAAPSKAQEGLRMGHGRNVGGRSLVLGWQHTYREVQTQVTKRQSITSAGTTEVSLSDEEKGDCSTSMHMDMLQIRFGFTDWLEAFGKCGVNYKELDKMGFAGGGGLRLNLFEVQRGGLRGFYGALQGEYLAGKLEYGYASVAGNRFNKKADWQQFTGKCELGVVRSRMVAYVGGVYFHNREDTERTQLENLPPPLTSVVLKDELEEKNSFGACGGVTVYITPGLLINLEGELITQDSISGTLEYRF
jgi:hypothetical protein